MHGTLFNVLALTTALDHFLSSYFSLIDSNPAAEHKFKVNGTALWALDETDGTETVLGGVITGGNADYGGGVYIGTGRPVHHERRQYRGL